MRLIILSLFIFSCAHKKTSLSNETKRLLFPYGTYQHSVKVTLVNGKHDGPKEFQFNGIFDFNSDRLKLVGLSPMGTSVFRAEENLKSNELKLDIYIKSSRQADEKIRRSYMITRDVLTLSITDPDVRIFSTNGQGMPLEMEIPSQKELVQVTLSSYDKQKIPQVIVVSYKDLKMEVKVISYEFKK